MITKTLKYKLTILWSILIIFLLLIPTSEITKPKIIIPYFDKIIHFGIFSIWGIIFQLENKTKHRIPPTIILGAGFAISTELMQKYLTTTRTFDYLDILADLTGIILSVIVFEIYWRINKKMQIK